ncbi:hypothetical protein ACQ902_001632 [Vibrio mimicus]
MQKSATTASKIWRGVKFFFKWLWLITMFLFGLALYFIFFPLGMFEYSFSLSELDIIETSFMVFLVIFFYRYVQLCRQIDAPLVRKIITPWLHQAYLGLFSIGLVLISIKFFDYNWEQPLEPLDEIMSTILTAVVFGYSYYRMSKFAGSTIEAKQTVDAQGAVE